MANLTTIWWRSGANLRGILRCHSWIPIFAAILFIHAPLPAYGKSSDPYKSYDEVVQWTEAFAAQNKLFVTREFLGYSTEGRPIFVVRLARDQGRAKPQIFFNGAHHGDEVISTAVVISLAEFLATNFSLPAIDRIVTSFDILLQPVVNPDGYVARRRNNSEGVDLNRDYPLPGQLDRLYFQAKETKLLNQIFQQRDIYASVSVHSGTEAVLWPLCFTHTKPSESELFSWLASRAARAMDIRKSLQSYYDYPSFGEQIDYAYLNYGSLALTFEVSERMAPDEREIPYYSQRTIRGALQFMGDLVTLVEPEASEAH